MEVKLQKIESFFFTYQKSKACVRFEKINYKTSYRAVIIKNIINEDATKYTLKLLFLCNPRHTHTNKGRALNLRAINLKQFTCMKLHRDKLNFRNGNYFILSTSLTIKTTHHSYR